MKLFLLCSLLSSLSIAQTVLKVDGSKALITKEDLRLYKDKLYTFKTSSGKEIQANAEKSSTEKLLIHIKSGEVFVGEKLELIAEKSEIDTSLMDDPPVAPKTTEEKYAERLNRITFGLDFLSISRFTGDNETMEFGSSSGDGSVESIGFRFGYERNFSKYFRFGLNFRIGSGDNATLRGSSSTPLKFDTDLISMFDLRIGYLPTPGLGLDFLIGSYRQSISNVNTVSSATSASAFSGDLTGFVWGFALSYEYFFTHKFGIRPEIKYSRISINGLEEDFTSYTLQESMRGNLYGGNLSAVWRF